MKFKHWKEVYNKVWIYLNNKKLNMKNKYSY